MCCIWCIFRLSNVTSHSPKTEREHIRIYRIAGSKWKIFKLFFVFPNGIHTKICTHTVSILHNSWAWNADTPVVLSLACRKCTSLCRMRACVFQFSREFLSELVLVAVACAVYLDTCFVQTNNIILLRMQTAIRAPLELDTHTQIRSREDMMIEQLCILALYFSLSINMDRSSDTQTKHVHWGVDWLDDDANAHTFFPILKWIRCKLCAMCVWAIGRDVECCVWSDA